MSKIIIDVREPFEYKMGHVKGALNIPPHCHLERSRKISCFESGEAGLALLFLPKKK
jgi:rhodanese-related sulfurtransferase